MFLLTLYYIGNCWFNQKLNFQHEIKISKAKYFLILWYFHNLSSRSFIFRIIYTDISHTSASEERLQVSPSKYLLRVYPASYATLTSKCKVYKQESYILLLTCLSAFLMWTLEADNLWIHNSWSKNSFGDLESSI